MRNWFPITVLAKGVGCFVVGSIRSWLGSHLDVQIGSVAKIVFERNHGRVQQPPGDSSAASATAVALMLADPAPSAFAKKVFCAVVMVTVTLRFAKSGVTV